MRKRKITIVRKAPFFDVLEIAKHMRARDREEIYATRYGEDANEVARDVVGSGFYWVAYVDGRPAAVFGAYPRWPRVWSAFAFGTDDWKHAVISVTRTIRSVLMPAIYKTGAIRVDAMSLDTHTDARAWLEYLGATGGETLANWGKKGQNYTIYTWTRTKAEKLIKGLA
ncbi:hypothetical protein [uncultured Cohaesibacter sp.]|uniref:hypothetical protein n=1 Tax=uncultured Cohaesibacter sp. TaxID=1002546 RepID=UPI0029C62A72|nr:hypothetical protein [uncultured Cohaesibacter sp.]